MEAYAGIIIKKRFMSFALEKTLTLASVASQFSPIPGIRIWLIKYQSSLEPTLSPGSFSLHIWREKRLGDEAGVELSVKGKNLAEFLIVRYVTEWCGFVLLSQAKFRVTQNNVDFVWVSFIVSEQASWVGVALASCCATSLAVWVKDFSMVAVALRSLHSLLGPSWDQSSIFR